MKTREPLHPELQISKTIDEFQSPPCPPPRGKDVLERFYGVLHSQQGNSRKASDAAQLVAKELHDLWLRGDARIPRCLVKTIQKKIMDMREMIRYLSDKAKKGRPAYAEKASSSCENNQKLLHFFTFILILLDQPECTSILTAKKIRRTSRHFLRYHRRECHCRNYG